MYALLKEFRYAVIVDPDAYFAKPDVPLHLLMGRWGWKPHSRCAPRRAGQPARPPRELPSILAAVALWLQHLQRVRS